MSGNNEMFYCLNWELSSFSPLDDLSAVTKGNEVIEIFIHSKNGSRPRAHYTIPIVQAGQPFASLQVNLLYPKDKCSDISEDIFVKIRILRGLQQRLIYTNDFVLSSAYYTNRNLLRVPIYRLWYWEDYFRMIRPNRFS